MQGLRALAVLLVVVYHVWFGRVSGGVDVFFVITGFLLTGQLARTRDPGSGAVVRRWRRSFVRLTPAAFTVLVGTMIAAAAILPEGRWPQTVREVIASALFVENWQLAADSVDYTARSNAVSVVQHYWSLSIQAQFSLVWPLFMTLVALIATRAASRHTHYTVALLGVFAASLFYSVALTVTDQPLAYFHSLTRLWEFALGGLLALWLDRIRLSDALRVAAGWLGVVGLVACGIVLQVDAVFPGFAALWPTTCAALVLLAGHTRLPWAVDRILASRAANRLGDLSYGLYLWHWPILVLHLGGGGIEGVGFWEGLAVIGASLVLAALTHRFVEKPLLGRRSDARAVRWCAMGLVVVLGLAVGWKLATVAKATPDGVVGDREHPGAAAIGAPLLPVAQLLPPPVTVYEDFVQTNRWQCTAVEGFDSDYCVQPVGYRPTKRVLIVGDSHAQQITGTLIPLAAVHHWQLSIVARGACPFSTGSDTDPSNDTCDPFHQATMDIIARDRPDVVVTIGSRDVRAGLTENTPQDYVDAWRQVTDLDIPVVAVRDNPRFDYSIPDCVSTHDRNSPECGVDRAAVYSPTPPWARLPDVPQNVRFVDIADAVCDQHRCPAEVGNVLVYLDDNHISASYAATMAGRLDQSFVAAIQP
ncbi:acyltransferase family protein [Pseudonocardia sp. CA-107938]|uniref:acyltransferase family protein n=1 Tax=Pseudonocardia sp. CA-107938 TaxID=3240021 RepID=UPI003D918A5A